MLIGWKTASLAFHLASLRYRALLPALCLQDRGIQSRIFSTGALQNLDNLDALVIVKSYGADDLYLASAASHRGIPIVIDLCDNIFIEGYGKKAGVGFSSPALHFDKIANLASTVVVTTSPLAQIVRSRIGAGCSVLVIPDGIETPADVRRMEALLAAADLSQRQDGIANLRQRLASVRRKVSMLRSAQVAPLLVHLARRAVWSTPARIRHLLLNKPRPVQPATRAPLLTPILSFEGVADLPGKRPRSIVWFGHHGADYAKFGMLDLTAIRTALEAAATTFDVELVVVSNSETKFKKHIQPFAIRTRYVEWSNASLLSELNRAAVVVIPNSLDDFSICKSSNRTVLSLLNGVPVVATRTPALDGLVDCIILDDFDVGLRTYLGDPARASADLERSRHVIDSLYGSQLIGDQWQRVLQQAQPYTAPPLIAPTFAVVIQSSLDMPLLRPIIKEAIRRGKAVLAILGSERFNSVAAISNELMDSGVAVISLSLKDADGFALPNTIRSLLSAAESTLHPHRFAHVLTRRANAAGIFTATLQHGYETPGLTYHDNLHSARKIGFASKRIYLWGQLSTLCAEVPASTAERCRVVGCPNTLSPVEQAIGLDASDGALSVGIFENLHWHRYSAAYRQSFIDGVTAVTARFPKLAFTLRTHPTGRWLDSAEAKPLCDIKNLQLLKSEAAPLDGDPDQNLFHGVSAVISTPSSVIVHAARRGFVVGVVTGDLSRSVSRYEPLHGISGPKDWLTFVKLLQSDAQRCKLQTQSQIFIDMAIHPGDAALRIIDDLCTQIEGG